jgi:arsenate reductase
MLETESRKEAIPCGKATDFIALGQERQAKKLACCKAGPYHGVLFVILIIMDITIYHNPHCSNSRNTLAAIRDAGLEPRIVDYLATPPARAELVRMLAAAGLRARDAIRTKESLYTELGLGAEGVDDDALIDAMLAHPVLMNRPFVVTPKGVRLCRPPETVQEIL